MSALTLRQWPQPRFHHSLAQFLLHHVMVSHVMLSRALSLSAAFWGVVSGVVPLQVSRAH